MKTNFFQNLANLKVEGDLQMVIKMAADDRMLISVLLTSDKVGDKTRRIIPPIILKGSAIELDEGFFSSIGSPVQKTAGLFVNMEQYAKAQEEAKIQLKEKQDKAKKQKPKEKPEEAEDSDGDENDDETTEAPFKENKKYMAQLKKSTDLEAEGKYGQAIAQLPKAEEFPDYRQAIETRLLELKTKGGYLL